jgi:hypothetical protein
MTPFFPLSGGGIFCNVLEIFGIKTSKTRKIKVFTMQDIFFQQKIANLCEIKILIKKIYTQKKESTLYM